ncbi:MAG TPA: hypothetical protein VFM93_08600 [Candidatus Limnocylindria bacterium]|nr:hypothetical protein [Candidatus Limnocylindria bacterium]
MGTRYGDQPPEAWAEPESLDPTPTWKQFLLVGALLALMLALMAGVALLALATELATPPALVPGDRLVLARKDLPAVGRSAVRFAPPLVADARGLWIHQPEAGEYAAVSAWWTDPDTGDRCRVEASDPMPPAGVLVLGAVRQGPFFAAPPCAVTFSPLGDPLSAPRGLDRYLVSVSDDRVVVNLSRVIRGAGSTPQPRVSPLPAATPTPAPTR